MQIESGGNPTARNPRSSAYGAGQFVAGTWLPMIEKYRPDLAQGRTRDEILALRGDVNLNREMVAAYGDENGQALASAGLPVTDSSKYLAHFLGPAGAKTVLSADIGTPVASLLSEDVIRANPDLRNMTVGDLELWANRKAYGPSGVPQTPATPATGLNFPLPSVRSLDRDEQPRQDAFTVDDLAGLNFPPAAATPAGDRSPDANDARSAGIRAPETLLSAVQSVMAQVPPEIARKPMIADDGGKLWSLNDYEAKLQNATKAGDAEAVEYFRSQIERGLAIAEGDAASTEPPSPPPSAAFQRGNQSGSFLDTAYQGLTFGFGDEFSGALAGGLAKLRGQDFTPAYEKTRDYVRGRVAREREDAPLTSIASEIAGGLPTLAFAPFAGASGLNTAMGTGALYGAGSSEGGVGDRAMGGLAGATVGALGHHALSGLSALTRTLFPRAAPISRMPEFRAQVRRLDDAGIEVTPAERISNSDARRAERIFSAYAGQTEGAMERPVQLHRRLMEMSNFAPDDVRIGELSLPAVERARARFNAAYDRVLNGARVPTPDLNPRLNAIDQEFSQLLLFEQKANVRRILDDFADQIGQNRTITGDAYKRLRSNLGKQAFEAQKSDANRYLAPVYRGMRNALDDAFRRNVHPDRAARLARLDRQYSGFKILEKSVDNIDAIGTMANAARRNRGRLNPAFHDLVTAYQDVLLRKGFPTSQTPEGLASANGIPPLMAMARTVGTRYGSAPFNAARNALQDRGLTFPLPPNLADFIIGQRADPQVVDELQKAMGLSE
jgi:hypothetical protein